MRLLYLLFCSDKEAKCPENGQLLDSVLSTGGGWWLLLITIFLSALALAISRDGSSGGVIRIACIEESGVERLLFTGNDIPQFSNE